MPLDDIVDLFCDLTVDSPSCLLYREWAGIALVAGALERRVWTQGGKHITFPNVMVGLIGPPGAGKDIITDVKSVLDDVRVPGTDRRAFYTGRDSYSKASLMDDLHELGTRSVLLKDELVPYTYHCIFVAAEEFGQLFPSFDIDFITSVTNLWNAKASYKERRRSSEIKTLEIPNPILSLLFGYQPQTMQFSWPEVVWGQGFTRRINFVYSPAPEKKSIWARTSGGAATRTKLLDRLSALSQAYGVVEWSDEAKAFIDDWHMNDGPPAPQHHRLAGYLNTRTMLLLKLSMIAAFSDTPLRSSPLGPLRLNGAILKRHVQRAQDWLFRAEETLPAMFQAMKGESDVSIMNDLHAVMMRRAIHSKHGVHESLLWQHLQAHVHSNRVPAILQAMERSGMMVRAKDDKGMLSTEYWLPVTLARNLD